MNVAKNLETSVDVVILSWNRSDSTIATLQNIQNQVEIVPQIFLIDQGSDEDQLKKLRNYIKSTVGIKLIELGKNIGVAAGRNLGMRLGQSDVIVSIDNDAIFESDNAIKQAVELFENNEALAAVGFKILNFYSGNIDQSSWVYPKNRLAQQELEFIATRFCGAGHALRRSALEKTNYYDESLFFYWEELDLSYQFINSGFDIIYYPKISVLHKTSSEQRVFWQGDRYYYLVRNAIYLNWKYYRSFFSIIIMSIGYIVKGLYNGLCIKSIKGIIDAIKMIHENTLSPDFVLSAKAKKYIFENDVKLRGSFINRLKSEVLARLQNNENEKSF